MSYDNCEHPDRKPKDGNCSEEQIKKCHGEKEIHPCEGTKEKN
ncbi:MAG: hypothetical protein ACOC6D_03690 [Atribacterota bacterium]